MTRTYTQRRLPKIEEEFHRLTVKELFTHTDGKTIAKCLCKCGNYTFPRATALVQGKIVSCGCWKAEKASERTKLRNYKHGKGNLDNRLYRIWCAMRSRCRDISNSSFKDYGGRGIIVCHPWEDYNTFEDWAIQHGYADSLTIDRIDVNGNYTPDNCRWISKKEQARNRRNNRLDTVKITAFGETKTLYSWLSDQRCTIQHGTTICYRIGAGWTPEEAITKPSERKK